MKTYIARMLLRASFAIFKMGKTEAWTRIPRSFRTDESIQVLMLWYQFKWMSIEAMSAGKFSATGKRFMFKKLRLLLHTLQYENDEDVVALMPTEDQAYPDRKGRTED